MAPFVLKFKGNKSFSPFSNLADSDALTKTWKVCTKVAVHLEQGQRLENLSWRMWHLQNLIVETDNAKSRREFKKLSKNMGERLDKDKGRSIEELEAPGFKIDKLRRHAVGSVTSNGSAGGGGRTGMKGMTFTFPADPATNRTPGATVTAHPTTTTKKPLRSVPHKDEFDESMDVMNATAVPMGLVIDTSGISNLENAPTPTSAFVSSEPQQPESANRVADRTHYRSHADSISSISSEIYNSQFAPPSPPMSINGVALRQPQQNQHQQQQLAAAANAQSQSQPGVLRFPNLFDNGFGPVALLCPAPSVKQSSSYGEAIGFAGLSSSSAHAADFGILRPTFEFPLDELMNADNGSDGDASTNGGWTNDDSSNLTNSVSSLSIPTPVSASMASFRDLQITADAMQGIQVGATGGMNVKSTNPNNAQHHNHIDIDVDLDGDELIRKSPPLVPSQSAPASPATFNPSVFQNEETNGLLGSNAFLPVPPPLTLPKGATLPGPSPTPSPAPAPAHHRLPRRYSTTNAPPPSASDKKSGRHPSATAPRTIRASYGNSAPGGVKSECANCGANSTPLWRRGLNDELNCNACGLFAKLHKRPRPKSLRNSAGEGGSRNPGWASNRNGDETGEPVSCYNCATIATPLWRKDEDGRTLCNACGLYLKLHGEKRPSSMKSDVIRKRSRHDARRGTSSSATPSASPGASRRTSPTPPIAGLPSSSNAVDAVAATYAASQSPNQQQMQLLQQQQQQQHQQHQQQQQQQQHQTQQQVQPQQHSPSSHHNGSPYNQTATSFEYGPSAQNQDNTPVDLMSMNHSMVSDSGVDPALGGMTFSPGLTYTETLHYPGPLSLSYYFAQYGMPPDTSHNGPHADQPTPLQQQQLQQQQQQQQQQQAAQQQQAQQQQQQAQQQPQQQQMSAHAVIAAHSPTIQSVGSPRSAVDVTSFGPQQQPTTTDGTNAWDQGFQLPFNPTYPFPYGASMADASTVTSSGTGNQGGSLGVVHPPMLPYWYSEIQVPTKTEPEHEISFGHH